MANQEERPKGRHGRKLILMVGESGSGKSTIARAMVDKDPDKFVRISRDDLRIELAKEKETNKGRGFEDLVIKVQTARAFKALEEDKNVIIDDTNLNKNTQLKWENKANHKAEFAPYRVFTDLSVCIERDALRTGTSHVGRAVIERQFLLSGRMKEYLDQTKLIVLCDIDGTLADHHGVRSPFDEGKVLLDRCHTVVRDWVNELAKDHTICIVSGRHSTCSDDTVKWLNLHGVKFNHIFMRHSWDNRADTVVKKEILDELLLNISGKEQIAFVLDDRPKVVKIWRENGIKVYPVAGTTDHAKTCTYEMKKEDRRCPICYALADF